MVAALRPSTDFRAAGGRLVRFKPVWYALTRRMADDLRNHRKIVVADGSGPGPGGRNIGDHYLADGAEQRRHADLSLSLHGPAAAALEEICRSDWRYATGSTCARRHRAVRPAPSDPTTWAMVRTAQHRCPVSWPGAGLRAGPARRSLAHGLHQRLFRCAPALLKQSRPGLRARRRCAQRHLHRRPLRGGRRSAGAVQDVDNAIVDKDFSSSRDGSSNFGGS